MKSFKNTTFVCLDCETTGLDIHKDRIIEIAIATFTIDEILETYEALVDPEMEISAASQAIHHITQQMVVGAPKIDELLPKVFEMVGNHPIIGHGIRFDIDMIMQAAKRRGMTQSLEKNILIDTLRLARLYGESSVNSLERLRQHFSIEDHGAHRAMSDVLVNIDVFKSLAKDYKSPHEIIEVLKKPIQMKTMPLGKHKGRTFKEVPFEYLKWASHQEFDEDLLFSIRSELKRRRQPNQFMEAINPFKDLL